jgi:hypothetical protein
MPVHVGLRLTDGPMRVHAGATHSVSVIGRTSLSKSSLEATIP